LPFLGMALFFI